jgi:hypothetical protein
MFTSLLLIIEWRKGTRGTGGRCVNVARSLKFVYVVRVWMFNKYDVFEENYFLSFNVCNTRFCHPLIRFLFVVDKCHS